MYCATTWIITDRQNAHCLEKNSCQNVPYTDFHHSGNDFDGFLVAAPESQSKVTRTITKTSHTCIQAARMAPSLAQSEPIATLNSRIGRSNDNSIASERFITPHKPSTSATIAPQPCVEFWMFKCAVVGCAVAQANVVSDADNRKKTFAT